MCALAALFEIAEAPLELIADAVSCGLDYVTPDWFADLVGADCDFEWPEIRCLDEDHWNDVIQSYHALVGADCSSCCLDGNSLVNRPCPDGCQTDMTDRFGDCNGVCRQVFLNGSRTRFASCGDPPEGDGCLAEGMEMCRDADTIDGCIGECVGECPAECTVVCEAGCDDPDRCERFCGQTDFAATCQDTCLEDCYADNGHPSDRLVFGHPRDLAHNIVAVRLGSTDAAPYVVNAYGDDFFAPSFDAVVEQVFGGVTIHFEYHDARLGMGGDAELASGGEAVEVCPLGGQAAPPDGHDERWVPMGGGTYAVIDGFDLGSPDDVWPVTSGLGDGRDWYELYRNGAGFGVWPDVELPGGLSFATEDGPVHGTQDVKTGLLELLREDPAVGPVPFDPGAGDALTVLRTQEGWRVEPGRLAAVAAVESVEGGCAGEFVVYGGMADPVLEPPTACHGVLEVHDLATTAVREEGPGGQLTLSGSARILVDEGGAAHRLAVVAGGAPVSLMPGDPLSVRSGEAADAPGVGGGDGVHDAGEEAEAPEDVGAGGFEHGSWQDDPAGGVAGDEEGEGATCPEGSFHPVTLHQEDHPAQPIRRATVIRQEDGMSWTFFSDDRGRVVRRVNNTTGTRWERNFGGNGKMIGELLPFGDRWCRFYDEADNLLCAYHLPAPDRWAPVPYYRYDYAWAPHARLAAVFDPPSEGTEVLATYAWDERGNLQAVEQADGARTAYEVDERGRTTRVTSPAGHVTAHEHDPVSGQLTATTLDAEGPDPVQRRVLRDGLGRAVEEGGDAVATVGYVYHADGRVQSRSVQVDDGADQVVTAYEYDEAGILVAVEDPEKRRRLVRNGRGSLEAEVVSSLVDDAPSRATCFRYNDRGQVVETVLPEGQRVLRELDAVGRLTTVVRGVWEASPKVWDDECVDGLAAGLGRESEVFEAYEVDPVSGTVAGRTLGELTAEQYTYDGFGRVVETRRGDALQGVVEQVVRDALDRPSWRGTLSWEAGPVGGDGGAPSDDPALRSLTAYEYDHLGRVTSVASPWFVIEDGERRWLAERWLRREMVYLDGEAAREETDAAGQTTRLELDGAGRLVRTVLADGSEVVRQHEQGGRVVRETRPAPTASGVVERTLSYAAFGGLVSVEGDASGYRAAYDGFGRRVWEEEAGAAYGYSYGGFSERTEVWRRALGGGEAAELESATAYNRNGQPDTLTDGREGVRRFVYDGAARPAGVVYPGEEEATEVRYVSGTVQAEEVVERDGSRRTYGYDAAGRLVTVDGEPPEGAADDNGDGGRPLPPNEAAAAEGMRGDDNVPGDDLPDAEATAADDMRRRWAQEEGAAGDEEEGGAGGMGLDGVQAAGGLGGGTGPEGDEEEGAAAAPFVPRSRVRLEFEHDELGVRLGRRRTNPTAWAGGGPEAVVETQLRRDSLGRVASEWSPTLLPGTGVVTGWTRQGRPARVDLHLRNLDYAYDALGRLTEVTANGEPVVEYGYRGLGPPETRTYGSGVVETWSYDEVLRPVEVRTQGPGGDSVRQASLAWRGDGLLCRVDRSFGGEAATAAGYATDAYGRLVGESLGGAAAEVAWLAGAVEPAACEEVAYEHGTGTRWELDGADNWTSEDTGEGEVAVQVGPDNALEGFGGEVGRDEAGRTVAGPDGTTYVYDALGRLEAVAEGGDPQRRWELTYDVFGRLVRWSGPSGTTMAQYAGSRLVRLVRPDGADVVLVPGRGDVPVSLDRLREGEHRVFYLHAGFRQRVEAVTDGGGRLVERIGHSAYGEVGFSDAAGGPLAASVVGLDVVNAGGAYVPALGLHHLGARWYRPGWGRFLTPDPAGFAFGPNRFVYVGSRPLVFYDPTGLGPWRLVGDGLLVAWDFATGVAHGLNPFTAPGFRPAATRSEGALAVGEVTGGTAGLAVDAFLMVHGASEAAGGGFVLVASEGVLWPVAVPMMAAGAAKAVVGYQLMPKHVENLREGMQVFMEGDGASRGGGRAKNKLRPDPDAQGPHSTFKRDPATGRVSGHAEWDAKGNPVKRTDVTGRRHGGVDTPHRHEYGPPNTNPETGQTHPGRTRRVRPATPDEIPQ